METIKNLAKSLAFKAVVYGLGLVYMSLALVGIGIKWLWHICKGTKFWEVKERTLPPLCLQDAAYGRHSYIKLKDVKIHYVENGDRSKPLMLFVHGFPEFWFSWRRQLQYFAKTHWVVAIDMRGYGDSDKPSRISDYRMDYLQQDIVDVIKALNRETCILVGHDWGAAVCWCVGAKFPQIIEKLIILNCPHPGAFRKKVESSIKQFLKSWYMFLFQIPYLPEKFCQSEDLEMLRHMFENKITEEELEGYKYVFSRKGAFTAPINYYRCALHSRRFLEPDYLPIITRPTLIIWGENDIALDKELAEMSKPFVQNIKVEYIPNGNHFVQSDRPNEVNSLIEQFVNEK